MREVSLSVARSTGWDALRAASPGAPTPRRTLELDTRASAQAAFSCCPRTSNAGMMKTVLLSTACNNRV